MKAILYVYLLRTRLNKFIAVKVSSSITTLCQKVALIKLLF